MAPGIRSIVRFALLLASAFIASPPAAAQQVVETDGPFVHIPAAAVFAPRVGDFQRSEVYRYDPQGRDVSASYDLATPEGRLLITVYIYPAAPAAAASQTRLCDEEFSAVNAAISTQHNNAAPLERGDALKVPGSRRGLRHWAMYRFLSPFDGQVQEIRSEAHLYCYVGDWHVKYRVSAPAAVATRALVQAFIRAGPWPGRGVAATVARADLAPRRAAVD